MPLDRSPKADIRFPIDPPISLETLTQSKSRFQSASSTGKLTGEKLQFAFWMTLITKPFNGESFMQSQGSYSRGSKKTRTFCNKSTAV